MPSIRLTTAIPAAIEDCFALSLSVDAHTASMQGSGERIVAGVRSGQMGLDDTVTWAARHVGVRFTMTSRISEYAAPHRFVDEQVSGPFRAWWHEHRFDGDEQTTLMTDLVEFEAPLGMLGRAVSAVFLTRYMTGLLEKRNRWLVEALTSAHSA